MKPSPNLRVFGLGRRKRGADVGARGGVFIAGGISPRIVDFLSRSEFRSRFEAKGRLRSYLEAVPSSVIVHPAAAFLGLKSLLDL